MAAKPYLTTNDLIECVKRKINAPVFQNSLTNEDIIKFLNEELLISQVPAVLTYHAEYYTTYKKVPLRQNGIRYAIPTRAIGMKLRDMMYADTSNNLTEMTQISSEDKAYFQRQLGSTADIYKFYVEGNDIVLSPGSSNQTGNLMMYYYLRPNQLVVDERAAVMNSFSQTITLSGLSDGDYVVINSVEVTARTAPTLSNEFAIGVSDIASASNMAACINSLGLGVSAANNAGSSNVVTLTGTNLAVFLMNTSTTDPYAVIGNITTNNSSSMVIPSTLICNFNSIPSHLASGSVIDFLETNPGHRIKGIDIVAQTVSGNQMIFNITDIPYNLAANDYVCTAYESIIPYLPPDLHNGLAERACARILAAMGDQQGLAMVNAKLAENHEREGTLLDQRVDGSPLKIFNKYSLVRMAKWGRSRRRY